MDSKPTFRRCSAVVAQRMCPRLFDQSLVRYDATSCRDSALCGSLSVRATDQEYVSLPVKIHVISISRPRHACSSSGSWRKDIGRWSSSGSRAKAGSSCSIMSVCYTIRTIGVWGA